MSSKFNSTTMRNKTPPVCQKHTPNPAPLPATLPDIIRGTITVAFDPIVHVTPLQFTHDLRRTPATNIWQASGIEIPPYRWFLGFIEGAGGQVGGCSWSVRESGVFLAQGTGLFNTMLFEVPFDSGQHLCTFNQIAIESRYRFYL